MGDCASTGHRPRRHELGASATPGRSERLAEEAGGGARAAWEGTPLPDLPVLRTGAATVAQ